MKNLNFTIITFYQFKHNSNVQKLQNLLTNFCSFHKIKGTILLAQEGINGTVAGLDKSIDFLESELVAFGFNKLELKTSTYDFMPFSRLKIKIKKEIVTFDSSFLDVRNNFEVEMGTFERSVNPKTKNFSEFKKYIDANLSNNKSQKVALFCTGGIRCEKASSYMLKQGFENIFQLKGGILQYLKDVSCNESKWNGECFVFDNRVSIQNEMLPGTYELCHACRNPLNPKDRQSDKYVKGISCKRCIDKVSTNKKLRLQERNKQIEIAKKKGLYNPYIKLTASDF